MKEAVYHVRAVLEDEQGGGDGAYDLCGRFTEEQLVAALRKTLSNGFDLSNAAGQVKLVITIGPR